MRAATANQDRRSGKGCWYYTVVYDCVLCAKSEVYRERRYGRKPGRPEKRWEFHETACSEHFV